MNDEQLIYKSDVLEVICSAYTVTNDKNVAKVYQQVKGIPTRYYKAKRVVGNTGKGYIFFMCDNCKRAVNSFENYCSYCGAKLEDE